MELVELFDKAMAWKVVFGPEICITEDGTRMPTRVHILSPKPTLVAPIIEVCQSPTIDGKNWTHQVDIFPFQPLNTTHKPWFCRGFRHRFGTLTMAFNMNGRGNDIIWLVVSNVFYFPFHIWDVILPIDELIFSIWLLHHQPENMMCI